MDNLRIIRFAMICACVSLRYEEKRKGYEQGWCLDFCYC